MNLLTALLLGIIQGLTEFLPVSSSGHLAVFGRWFGLQEPDLTFDILVHCATLLAILWLFRRDLWSIAATVVARPFTRANLHTPAQLLVATLPAATIGLTLRTLVHNLHAQLAWVGALLLCNGVLLLAGRRLKEGHIPLEQTGPLQALVMGFAQALAILPGISRSGSTILAGMAGGLNREAAARFSFLMAIPVILGAEMLEFRHMGSLLPHPGLALPYTCGFLAAFLSGLAALKLLMWLLRGGKFFAFGHYCLLFGGTVLLHTLLT